MHEAVNVVVSVERHQAVLSAAHLACRRSGRGVPGVGGEVGRVLRNPSVMYRELGRKDAAEAGLLDESWFWDGCARPRGHPSAWLAGADHPTRGPAAAHRARSGRRPVVDAPRRVDSTDHIRTAGLFVDVCAGKRRFARGL